MRIIVAGGRYFNDYEKLKKVCDKILQNQTEIEIVSGTAKGADKLGEKYAEEKGYKIKQFVPYFSVGKKGGIIRNRLMSEYADALIAFWDGESRGTKNMIELAKKAGLKVRIIKY